MNLRTALLLALSLGLGGCYSQVTAYDGKFTLAYASPLPQSENFVKPLAPGAKLDLHVFANGTSDKQTIVRATSSMPGVLAVDAVRGETLTIRGVAPGVSELTVVVRTADGAEQSDKMFFHVAKPALHALEHACTEEPSAVYVRGQNVDVFHGLATADKRAVIGYGWVPVAIEPAGALELTAQPQAGTVYRYRSNEPRAQVTVRSLVDDSKLSLQIVDPSDLKTARLAAHDRMLIGQHDYVVAHVELGSAPVCNQNALTRARSLTPDICSVSARLEDSPDESNREQLAEVVALAYGTCRLELTLPELAGGKGIVLRHELVVGKVEYPQRRSEWPLYAWLGVLQIASVGAIVRALRKR